MSVYTEVQRTDLEAFLNQYTVGDLVSFEGISDGIENTNYFVTTTSGQYVLTLFEQHDYHEMGYFLDVMTFFYQQGIPSAHPEADKQGQYLNRLSGKPAALVGRLAGSNISGVATVAQCHAIGDILGQMHNASEHFTQRRDNGRGAQWRHEKALKLMPMLDSEHAALMQDEINTQTQYNALNLPTGLSHSDLFRDNALFDGDELKGIIDFYYACDDYLLYDLAVTVNDWCIDEAGLIDTMRYQTLMSAYSAQRTLTSQEREHWNIVLRAAALRFWLSRLQDKHFPREGELTQTKDPDAFLKILKQHREQPFMVDAA